MILETKLKLPLPKSGALLRTGLINLITNNLDKKLVLICAGAGYGKTTLLSQLAREAHLPCMFYDLDKGDSDLLVFYSYLIAGIKQVDPASVKYSEELSKQGGEAGKNIELFFGTLINELFGNRKEELFVILDNYHNLIEDSAVHGALDFFIDHLPEKVHVIISTRSVPPLPSMAKWRAKQDLFDLSRGNLAFTGGEIAALLKDSYQTILSADELSLVAAHTEGWITGIRLILQATGKDNTTVSESMQKQAEANQPLYEYFAAEILSAETPEMQAFLTECSILETMTPAACDAILDATDSERVLKKMEQRHLFVMAIGREEYKYHRLFREFLQKQIMGEAKKNALNLKAGQHYLRQGDIERAIEHFLEARSYQQAGQAIAGVSKTMIDKARFRQLQDWYRRMPDDISSNDPQHLMAIATILQEQGQMRDADIIFHQAENLLRGRCRNRKHPEKKSCLLARSLLKQSQIHWIAGLNDKALPVLEKALKSCPAKETKLRINMLSQKGILLGAQGAFSRAEKSLSSAIRLSQTINCSPVAANSNLANIFICKGELRKADVILIQVFDVVKGRYVVGCGIIYANIVKTAILTGDLNRAEKCLKEGWNCCQPYPDMKSISALNNASGLFHMQKGQWENARERFESALEGFRKIHWKVGETIVLENLARLCRYQRNYSKALEYLNAIHTEQNDDGGLSGVEQITERAFIDIACGEYGKAGQLLAKGLRILRRYGARLGEFNALLAMAALHVGKGEKAKAARLMNKMIVWSRTCGYDGLLVRECGNNPLLARLLPACKKEQSYLKRLGLPATAPPPKIHLKCFGGLQLSDEDGRLLHVVWPTEKTRSLFIYMATHNNSMVHRDVLIEQLWPGLPPGKGGVIFRTTVYRLRQTLLKAFGGQFNRDDIFTGHINDYQLLPKAQWLSDADDFDRLIAEAGQTDIMEIKAAMYKKALALVAGDYLPEIYDPWIEQARNRYSEQRLEALHWMAGYCAQQSDHHACIGYCEKYLAVDPLCEEIVKLCMTSYKCLGLISQIKACYHAFKKAVHKELHCDPSPEMEAFYHSLIDFDHIG